MCWILIGNETAGYFDKALQMWAEQLPGHLDVGGEFLANMNTLSFQNDDRFPQMPEYHPTDIVQ